MKFCGSFKKKRQTVYSLHYNNVPFTQFEKPFKILYLLLIVKEYDRGEDSPNKVVTTSC